MLLPLKMQHYSSIKKTEMCFKKKNSAFTVVFNVIDKPDI